MFSTNNMSTPIKNESVVQQVINKITDAIIVGELKPGDKLPTEMELISSLHVSRNSLRSAIQTLRAYGVLEVRRPEGTFVCSGFSPQMLNPMLYSILLQNGDASKDLVGLRRIIDTGVSKLVIAQGLTREAIKGLEASYDKLVKLLLAEGLSAQDVTVDLELPEQYLLGADPAVYAVYTLNGGAKQESTSVRVKAEITGLADLLEQSTGTTLEAAKDVEPGSSAWLLAGISIGCTVGAAVVTVLVLRVHARLKKRRKTARHRNKA